MPRVCLVQRSKDRVKFLYVAKGSCAELRTQILIGMEIGYLDKPTGQAWTRETREISAMIAGLIQRQPEYD
nr:MULTISPECIES: four helix bundle protein [unclassified Guyparkeria]